MGRELSQETISPLKLAHFVLRAKHFEVTRNWYVEFLGAHVVFENAMLSFLTFDEEHHRLAIVNLPDSEEQKPGQQGLDHVAFTHRSLADLLATYRRLERGGVTPYWCINHGPTTSMYYRDPEGNQVEFQADNFEKVEDLQAWFSSDAFAANPLGVTFDPEKLVERFERGDPIEELLRQGATD